VAPLCWVPVPVTVDQYVLLTGCSAANLPHAAAAVERWTDRQTPNRYTDPAPHTVQAVLVTSDISDISSHWSQHYAT